MPTKKPAAVTKSSPLDNTVNLEYKITNEPILDKRYRRLPRQVKEAFQRLHALAQTQPRTAIPELEQWIAKYPDLPMLYNYLGAAYTQAGQYKQAEQTILENYRRHPNYLFARLNYAELCMARGDYRKVAEILDHKFDLKLLYPERSLFHITEFTGFMWVVGEYLIGIGERAAAQQVYETLRQVAPADAATRRLRAALRATPLQRVVKSLLKK